MRRFFLRNYNDPVVKTERFKLFASGAQLVAISILVGFFVAPTFNAAVVISAPYRLAAGVVAVFLEVAAVMLLSYIPSPAAKGN